MYDLIEIYMGAITIIEYGLTLSDCTLAAAEQTYVADGMASFTCETST